ncbi:MAG: hypothetical protein HKN51_11930 [Saprospiraceae bacterium]|nr:hypothetical protein [Saprospiraceae bacterium]
MNRKISYQKFVHTTDLLMAPTDCYSVSDGTDELFTIDKLFGSPVGYIGPTTGASSIEAITTSVDGTIIYAMNNATWGTLDTGTGSFTAIGNVGSGNGAQGFVTFNDVDGIAIDGRTLQYFGSERQNDGAPDDLLFEFDPVTGNIIPDAFGIGIDYVVINTSSLPVTPTLYDIDDMGVNPVNGNIYGIANSGGSNDRLVLIDRTTGNVTDIGRITNGGIPLNDIESLSFSNDGTPFITSATTSNFYSINVTDATTTQLGSFPSGSDFEGIACLTDGANSIAGTVFFDYDYSGTYNGGDAPSVGELVYLYEDINNNGILDPFDEQLQTQFSDGSGDYLFEIAIEGNFLVSIDPGLHIMTTPDEIAVSFVGVGNTSVDNDFGYVCDNPIANDDNETTLLNTSVDVDVLDNDLGCNVLNPASVTNSGVLPPSRGSLTNFNSTTGEITYLPNTGFVGVDSFEYIVCDVAPISLCDTAMVYINVQCTGSPGQNDITGYVFEDLDSNQFFDVGESGQIGVTVNLYEDNSPNDLIPDGPPIQTMTTDGAGAYGFTLFNIYLTSYNQTYYLGSNSDDARERSNGKVETNRSKHNVTKDGNDIWNGFRFNNLTIPDGAIITDARIHFTATDDNDKNPANFRFFGQDLTSNPPTFNDCGNCSDITDRARTAAVVNWNNVSDWFQENTYTSPNLNSIVQEIIDDQSGLTNEPIVFITQSQSPGFEDRELYAYDNDPSKAAELEISYDVPGGGPYNYVIQIDETTLPSGVTMTTDNLETATFVSNGTADCANNFGFVTPDNCTIIYTNGFIRYNRLN